MMSEYMLCPYCSATIKRGISNLIKHCDKSKCDVTKLPTVEESAKWAKTVLPKWVWDKVYKS